LSFNMSPRLPEERVKLESQGMSHPGDNDQSSFAGVSSEGSSSGWTSSVTECFAMCPPFSTRDTQPGM
jgi:hypothetical protein